jgi:hypothetical protein
MIKKQVTIVLLTATLMLTACNMGATPVPTVDLNAINTAAFSTAAAQVSIAQTQTALAAPSATPTNTSAPLATVVLPGNGTLLPTVAGVLPTVSFNNTPTTPLAGFTAVVSPVPPAAATSALGDACNNAVYEGDVTIPDGTVIKPGVDFDKVWAVRNTGTCTWDEGFSFVFIGGSKEMDPINYDFQTKGNFVKGGDAINMTIPLTAPCTPGKYEGTWRMRNDQGYYFGGYFTVSFEVTEKDKNCGK